MNKAFISIKKTRYKSIIAYLWITCLIVQHHICTDEAETLANDDFDMAKTDRAFLDMANFFKDDDDNKTDQKFVERTRACQNKQELEIEMRNNSNPCNIAKQACYDDVYQEYCAPKYNKLVQRKQQLYKSIEELRTNITQIKTQQVENLAKKLQHKKEVEAFENLKIAKRKEQKEQKHTERIKHKSNMESLKRDIELQKNKEYENTAIVQHDQEALTKRKKIIAEQQLAISDQLKAEKDKLEKISGRCSVKIVQLNDKQKTAKDHEKDLQNLQEETYKSRQKLIDKCQNIEVKIEESKRLKEEQVKLKSIEKKDQFKVQEKLKSKLEKLLDRGFLQKKFQKWKDKIEDRKKTNKKGHKELFNIMKQHMKNAKQEIKEQKGSISTIFNMKQKDNTEVEAEAKPKKHDIWGIFHKRAEKLDKDCEILNEEEGLVSGYYKKVLKTDCKNSNGTSTQEKITSYKNANNSWEKMVQKFVDKGEVKKVVTKRNIRDIFSKAVKKTTVNTTEFDKGKRFFQKKEVKQKGLNSIKKFFFKDEKLVKSKSQSNWKDGKHNIFQKKTTKNYCKQKVCKQRKFFSQENAVTNKKQVKKSFFNTRKTKNGKSETTNSKVKTFFSHGQKDKQTTKKKTFLDGFQKNREHTSEKFVGGKNRVRKSVRERFRKKTGKPSFMSIKKTFNDLKEKMHKRRTKRISFGKNGKNIKKIVGTSQTKTKKHLKINKKVIRFNKSNKPETIKKTTSSFDRFKRKMTKETVFKKRSGKGRFKTTKKKKVDARMKKDGRIQIKRKVHRFDKKGKKVRHEKTIVTSSAEEAIQHLLGNSKDQGRGERNRIKKQVKKMIRKKPKKKKTKPKPKRSTKPKHKKKPKKKKTTPKPKRSTKPKHKKKPRSKPKKKPKKKKPKKKPRKKKKHKKKRKSRSKRKPRSSKRRKGRGKRGSSHRYDRHKVADMDDDEEEEDIMKQLHKSEKTRKEGQKKGHTKKQKDAQAKADKEATKRHKKAHTNHQASEAKKKKAHEDLQAKRKRRRAKKKKDSEKQSGDWNMIKEKNNSRGGGKHGTKAHSRHSKGRNSQTKFKSTHKYKHSSHTKKTKTTHAHANGHDAKEMEDALSGLLAGGFAQTPVEDDDPMSGALNDQLSGGFAQTSYKIIQNDKAQVKLESSGQKPMSIPSFDNLLEVSL